MSMHLVPLLVLLLGATPLQAHTVHRHSGSALPWDCPTLHGIADTATASLMLRFWTGSFLAENFPASDGGATPVSYWVNAEAMEAVMDAAERNGGQRFLDSAMSLMASQRSRTFRALFYDDASWMIAALSRASAFSPEYQRDALALFEGLRSAQDASCCGQRPGGMWWDVGHTQKATAANGGASVAGSRLHKLTGEASYLALSESVFEFWWNAFVNQQTYAVTDHEDAKGDLVYYKFTYNQGLMATAAVLLAEATGNSTYISRAQDVSSYMLSQMVDNSSVLSDGGPSACGGDCTLFKGPGFRGLALTQAVSPTPLAAAVMNASIASLWSTARDPLSGLFGIDWSSPPSAASIQYIGSTIAAVQALNIFVAQTCPSPPSPSRLEAEEGLLLQTGLSDAASGFSGWGYAVQVGQAGESLTVHFDVPSVCSQASVLVAYSAASGAAVRSMSLDQFPVQNNAQFPATSAWSTYTTAVFALDGRTIFPSTSGRHSLEIYNDGSGANELHVDYAQIICH